MHRMLIIHVCLCVPGCRARQALQERALVQGNRVIANALHALSCCTDYATKCCVRL